MSIRLAIAPWWVSWAGMAFMTAAMFGPIWLLLQATDTTIGRPIFITAIAFGLIMATLTAIIQRPIRRALGAAVVGLDRHGREQAITATRRGDVPADPAVLAAAIRLCTITLGLQSKETRWAKSVPWVGPVIFTVIAAVNFAAGEHRKALGYIVVVALIGATGWWSARARHRTQARLNLMNAAAERNDAR